MEWPRTIHDFFGFPDDSSPSSTRVQAALEVAQRWRSGRVPRGSGSTRTAGASTTGRGRCWPTCTRGGRAGDSARHQRPGTARVPLGSGDAPCPVARAGRAGPRQRQRRPQSGRSSTGAARQGFDWAQRFDEAARPAGGGRRPATCCRWPSTPTTGWPSPRPITSFRSSTLPARRRRRPVGPRSLVDGYAYGSLSMTCFTA